MNYTDPMSRVLIVTHEPLRENISGPGVRVLEMARALAGRHGVTVASPSVAPGRDDEVHVASYSFDRPESLIALARQADVLVVQGFTLSRFPTLATLQIPIVVDLYCPFTIEHLEMVTSRERVKNAGEATVSAEAIEASIAGSLDAQNAQLALGDFFICASERQRDFWIGALHTAGRINVRTYAADRTLRSLIDVVPFGLPDQPPGEGRREAAVLKGVGRGIREGDYVLLWAGSMLDWQDPQTLVRAVASIAARRSDVKLFFMGTRHPNPEVAPMRAVGETVALARDLHVLETHVFFNDWVPYAERWRYLTEADLGCSMHRDHFETRLSFRTRMLDYLWAGLPIVCTEGDVFASMVSDRGLGLVVPPGDAGALASAIERLLDDEEMRAACRRRLLEAAEEFRWRSVVTRLARFCDAPRFAADRTPGRHMSSWLTGSYRVTNWARRAFLAMGMSRAHLDQVKALAPVRMAMSWRNRLLLARARDDLAKR